MEEMNWHTIMEHGYRFMDWENDPSDICKQQLKLQASLCIRAVSPEAIAVCLELHHGIPLMKANSKASGKTARMRRLA